MAAEPLRGPGSSAGEESFGLPSIPGYRIDETLGRGSTGVVFRATQLAVDRQVALKVLHPEMAGRTRAVRRLQREARTAGRLAHPNIVSAIDMGESDGLWWYAMELVEGESLAERMKRTGKLTEREALRLFAPLADALDHAFRQGVVHRDIKPANILIDTSGRPRLVDLGLAFREEDPLITKPGGTLGTPHYVSPEQARNPQAADTRSDIWSLGATMYHAVCGRPPFSGESVAEILSSVLYGRVLDPLEVEPRLSKGLSLVLRKCLSRDPDMRYPTPRHLLEDLERLREKRNVSVRAKGLDPVRREHVWRGRALAIGAGIVALVGLVGFFGIGSGDAGDTPETPALTEAVWPELEEIARAIQGPDKGLAAAQADLADLAPVPMRHRERFEVVEDSLLRRLRDVQQSFAARIEQEVVRFVQMRDFIAAKDLVGPGLRKRLDEELAPRPFQVSGILQRIRAEDLARRVEEELDAYVADLARRVEGHFESMFARVEIDQKEGRWRSALEALEHDPIDLLSAVGIVPAGLPPERVTELEAGIREELRARRRELESAWRSLDAELAGDLASEGARLMRELRRRSLVGAADEILATHLAEREAELGLFADQRLPAVSDAARRKLSELSLELAQLQASLLEEDARNWFLSERERAAELRSQRRYEELLEVWERALEVDWLAPVGEEVRLERRATELLADLLARAAAGVKAGDGSEIALYVGSIERRGILDAGEDPLELGFELESKVAPPLRLLLRAPRSQDVRGHQVGPDAIERFAGLSELGREDPEDDLARALLRFDSGDVAGARRFLPERLPGEPALAALSMKLSAEVGRFEEREQFEAGRRRREASERLNVVRRSAATVAHEGDAEAAARAIEELLERYGDVDPVRSEAEELRQLRADLLAPPEPVSSARLKELFGPSSVEFDGRVARMVFEFDKGYEGAWSRGDWFADSSGWFAADWHTIDEVRSEGVWPRLVLRPPLDLDGRILVELEFLQPKSSGPPRLLVATVAGVHVVLRQHAASTSSLGIAAGDPGALRELVDLVEVQDKGSPFDGLVRGASYRLSIELEQKRGKATVRLWGAHPSERVKDYAGRVIVRQEFPRPQGEPGTSSLVLRSLEPVKLTRAVLEARVR